MSWVCPFPDWAALFSLTRFVFESLCGLRYDPFLVHSLFIIYLLRLMGEKNEKNVAPSLEGLTVQWWKQTPQKIMAVL